MNQMPMISITLGFHNRKSKRMDSPYLIKASDLHHNVLLTRTKKIQTESQSAESCNWRGKLVKEGRIRRSGISEVVLLLTTEILVSVYSRFPCLLPQKEEEKAES